MDAKVQDATSRTRHHTPAPVAAVQAIATARMQKRLEDSEKALSVEEDSEEEEDEDDDDA